MLETLRKFQRDECGGTAVEYALIAMIVAIGIIPALQSIPPVLNNLFSSFSPSLTN